MSAADKPIAAREPWSPAEHAAAVASATETAASLPDRSRTRMQVRLAAMLGQAGDLAAEARVLRQAGATLYRPGAPLHELAQRLVDVGEIDAARKLASDVSDPNETQQVLSGMLDGAIKAGTLDFGLETLVLAHHSIRQPNYDPFAVQTRTLANALAKAGRYRQAIAAFPSSGPIVGPDLPRIAMQACAADPTIADQAGKAVAVAALKIAASKFAMNAPVEEVRAFTACKGETAARQLIALMPPDLAERIKIETVAAAPSGDPNQLAADAFKASRDADEAKADQLFGAAKAMLDADTAGRSASREKRQLFDTSTSQVAVWMTKSKRPEAALALVAKLPALERLPILFTLTQTAIRGFVDPAIFVGAIGDAFSTEPALIEIEADEIRMLRRDLPLGSLHPKIQAWLDTLPTLESAPPMNRTPLPFKPMDQIQPLFNALEKAAPSVIVVRRVLSEAGRGQVTQAINEARALVLTEREAGFVELVREFVKALPDELLAPYATLEPNGLDVKRGITASPVDSLVVAVERVALNVNNLRGARDAFAAVDPGSPAKRYAATILAIGEARMGLPRAALETLAQIDDPSASFAVLSAIVQVKPST